jgi:hypothetical protein
MKVYSFNPDDPESIHTLKEIALQVKSGKHILLKGICGLNKSKEGLEHTIIAQDVTDHLEGIYKTMERQADLGTSIINKLFSGE